MSHKFGALATTIKPYGDIVFGIRGRTIILLSLARRAAAKIHKIDIKKQGIVLSTPSQ